MKKKSFFITSIFVAIVVFFGFSTAGATATDCVGLTELEDQIECAIQEGLDYMIPLQTSGYWYDGYTSIAPTGLMCVKLIDRARELGEDPFSEEYEYHYNLIAAINHVAGNLQPGMGGLFQNLGYYTTYSTGITAMCLADAASIDPDRTANVGGSDLTYQVITQELVDWLVAGQVHSGCGEGGWNYWGNQSSVPDNSVSGYATLGLGFASTLAGIDVSATLPDLNVFVNNVQASGGSYDGGSGYYPEVCGYGLFWMNILKTGNLLYELGMVGDTQGDSRVDRAIDFIVRHWANTAGDPNGSGWRGDYQAMFTMMKGLEGLGVDILPNPYDGDIDWFTEVATYITTHQQTNGSWINTAGRGTIYLATVWAMLTLEKAVPELIVRVPFDIKPGSCPNPINVKSRGVLPAAIMGTESFDVTTIDPASLRLRLKGTEDGGVAPLRWALADVGEPFEPYIGKEDCYDCVDCSCADGYLDLVFHFDTQEVVAALGDVYDGDCLVLEIIGVLMEEYNGTPIVGEDVVRILVKGKQK